MIKLFLLFAFLPLTLQAQLKRFSFTQPKMGSYFTITFYHNDSLEALKQANDCFALVDSLNGIYSDYIPGSELNLLSATAGKGHWVRVSAALLDILKASQRAWQLSSGAFDITVGPLVAVWRKARKENRFPDKNAVATALKATGFQYVLIDTVNSLVLLVKPGMKLDLGGIGQGYMTRKVAERLAENKITMTMVDASGDIVTGQSPPGKQGWTIAINAPGSADDLLSKKILAHNKAVITSGDVYQYIEHDGKRYSHIVNPLTGYGVTNQRNATVIADDGIVADWLATVCTILPLDRIKKLAARLRAEYMIGTIQKGKLVFYKSSHFENYRINNPVVK